MGLILNNRIPKLCTCMFTNPKFRIEIITQHCVIAFFGDLSQYY